MPSTLAQFNDKQVRTATTRKSKEDVTKSNNTADSLFKSEQEGPTTAENVKKFQMKGKQNDTFSVTSESIDYKPEDVELVEYTDNKLVVKVRRKVTTEDAEDDEDDEEFHDSIDLPNNVDDEDICLTHDKNGFLLIEEPLFVNDLNQSKTGDEKLHKWSDELFDELFGEIYW